MAQNIVRLDEGEDEESEVTQEAQGGMGGVCRKSIRIGKLACKLRQLQVGTKRDLRHHSNHSNSSLGAAPLKPNRRRAPFEVGGREGRMRVRAPEREKGRRRGKTRGNRSG